MLPWKRHAHQITINVISLSITVIFLKAVLNIARTLFIMVHYNAKKNVVSGICLETRFLTDVRFDKPHKLLVYESKTVPQRSYRPSSPITRAT